MSNRKRDADALYCPLCSLNSADCEEPIEHEGHWITATERAEEEQQSYEFDLWTIDPSAATGYNKAL